jgi:hypothetical protein
MHLTLNQLRCLIYEVVTGSGRPISWGALCKIDSTAADSHEDACLNNGLDPDKDFTYAQGPNGQLYATFGPDNGGFTGKTLMWDPHEGFWT